MSWCYKLWESIITGIYALTGNSTIMMNIGMKNYWKKAKQRTLATGAVPELSFRGHLIHFIVFHARSFLTQLFVIGNVTFWGHGTALVHPCLASSNLKNYSILSVLILKYSERVTPHSHGQFHADHCFLTVSVACAIFFYNIAVLIEWQSVQK